MNIGQFKEYIRVNNLPDDMEVWCSDTDYYRTNVKSFDVDKYDNEDKLFLYLSE